MGSRGRYLVLISVALLGAALYLKAPFLPEWLVEGPADAMDEQVRRMAATSGSSM